MNLEASELTIAVLHAIGREIERIMQNHLQEEWYSPMSGGESFHTKVFTARPYCWCDNEVCPPNFVWRHIEIRWYKHANRCVTSNHWIDPVTVSDMLEDCLDSLRDMEAAWRDDQ